MGAIRLGGTRAETEEAQEQYPSDAITQEYLWAKLSDWVQTK
jgi:hypothetical protein